MVPSRAASRPARLAVLFFAALSAVPVVLLSEGGRAQDVPAPPEEADAPLVIVDRENSWAVERFATRLSVLAQDSDGGYQSQWGMNRAGPGSELLWVLSPTLYTRIRQPGGVTHDIYLPIDIITAASPDALDAVSSASRDNEAFDLDIYSRARTDEDTTLSLHWGAHVEEQLRSGYGGIGVVREMAEDNAVLSFSLDGVVDVFDPTQFNGWDPGLDERFTLGANLSLSQLLSPTTILAGTYGVTGQMGTLQTTYNSVPFEGGDRIGDSMPPHRMRHALSLRLSQAIPDSRTYFNLGYRFYVDDFDILAHTLDGSITQYLGRDFSLRASYRFHTQTAARFWTPLFRAGTPLDAYRTADSDLSAFDAHELGATLRWYWDRVGVLTASNSYLEASYHHYERTNGLYVNVFSIGWGWQL